MYTPFRRFSSEIQRQKKLLGLCKHKSISAMASEWGYFMENYFAVNNIVKYIFHFSRCIESLKRVIV